MKSELSTQLNSEAQSERRGSYNWGPWLFYGTLVAGLAFFWWLLVDSHGIAMLH
jgi:hypothetical protein